MWTWIIDIFRSFISLFDRVVYWFVELLISLFDSISSVRVFDNSTIERFSSRIYVFIAIIMIFKVSFSIIQYIINPDNFNNNEKGMGKVIQGIILTLACLVVIPHIFELSYSAQEFVVERHYIERIVLGINSELDSKTQSNLKKSIPFRVLTSFVRPNISQITAFDYNDGVYTCHDEKTGKTESMFSKQPNNQIGGYNTAFGTCINNLSKEGPRTTKTDDENCVDCGTGALYNFAWKNSNYAILLDLINDKWENNHDIYIFDYKFIISTVAGVFIAIMYLNFCIDLAIRSVKFGFLQLIAPIPIISMIDPKSSKGGMMSKWVKTTISTYIGLFVRIAVVSFVVVIMGIVFNSNQITANGTEVNDFLKIVILFGALMFAKQAPKLISDLTGLDLTGDFKMNPLSRVPGGKLATKAITGTAKAAGALAGVPLRTAGQLGFTGLSTAFAALGSTAQATFAKMSGKSFKENFNSDRIAREWHLGRNRMANSAVGGVNKALANMGSIVGAKPKGIPIGDDSKKSANRIFKENEKQLELGKQLEEQVAQLKAAAAQRGEELSEEQINNSIYSNKDFAREVTDVKKAKLNMIAATNRYKELEARANSGDAVAAAQLSSAAKTVKDTETVYNSMKDHLEKKGAQGKYSGDFRKYNARKAYSDMYGSSGSDDNPVSESYMTELFNSNERPSVSSNPTSASSTSSAGGNNNQNSSGNNTGGSMPSVGRNNNNP